MPNINMVTARIAWLSASVGALAGCISSPQDRLATIDTDNTATIAAIAGTLRQALGVQNIVLGPWGDKYSSVVTVLPPQLSVYDTRSLAVPEIFDINMRKNACYLVRRTTNIAYKLRNVACRVAPSPMKSTGR